MMSTAGIALESCKIDGISELEATNRMLYFDDKVLETIPSQAATHGYNLRPRDANKKAVQKVRNAYMYVKIPPTAGLLAAASAKTKDKYKVRQKTEENT
eukprot:SAG11_NODE_133_length_15400_cov_10.132344_8_plen_99_part_00